MHKIKAAAKRQAWHNDDGSTNFNPFGKVNWSKRPEGDEENGLTHTMSDGNTLGSSAREERKSQFQPHVPAHANTMPNVHQSRPSSREETADVIAEERKENSQESNESGTNTSGTLVPPEPVGEDLDNQPRRRKMGGLLDKLHRKRKDSATGGEVKKTKSNRSAKKFTLWSQFQHTILNSWINVLLILVPVGIALGAMKANDVAVFTVNFVAIIPLAAMLSFATEELALRTGETIGGLLNATFGNAVELIVSILALFDNQIDIVQTSLIGSILSNLLLVMGMCFFFGGLKRVEQHFNITVAQTAASLLALAIGSLIIPTVYDAHVGTDTYDPDPTDTTPGVANKDERLTAMSRGTSILLLLVYGCYLYFQLSTHASMYNEPSKKAVRRKPKVEKSEKGDAIRNMVRAGNVGASTSTADQAPDAMIEKDDEDDEPQEPSLTLVATLITLAASTALVALCAEYLVDAIDDITKPPPGGGEPPISREFVGLILLPIVGNAAEHATAVTVAVKDKMDLAIGVAVGSSMQIALLVLPLIVTIGWMAGKSDMNLAFDSFQVIILFVAVLLVNYLIGDGKSHWLEGILLNVLYLIIAIAAWYYPSPTGLS